MFQDQVRRFMFLGRQLIPAWMVFPPPELGKLRRDLIMEEAIELCEAWRTLDERPDFLESERAKLKAEVIDGMVDLLYVVFGAAVTCGINLDPFWDLIHDNNMSKVDGRNGPPVFREDGKLLKPHGWKPPEVLELMRRIHKEESSD